MTKKMMVALAVAASAAVVQPLGTTGTVTVAAAGQYQRGTGGGWADRMIEQAFQDALRRSPDEFELRRYRVRVHEDHWNADDIRNDLRDRRDYQSHSDRTTRDRGSYDIDRTIRTAYQDILGRTPDPEGLRDYRRKMIDEGWTERQLRDALRRSDEHRTNPSASADRIINRAYQDILGRAPDASGLSSYRNQITNHGGDEHDVRDALMNSPEYRQKGSGAMTQDKAREIVRRAYLSVLGREPDPASEPFVQRVLRDHWTEREVARELRNSDEYRNKQQ